MIFIAALFGIVAVWALVSGTAYWNRKTVTRRDQPDAYWTSVGVCIAMAVLFVSVDLVR